MWASRLEEGAGSLLQSAAAAAVGSVSQSLLPCSGGICAAPVGPVPPCLLAQSQHSMCHRKCRPRSARFMRKHSCRPSHLPHLDCFPHFKGFLSWWANDALPGRPVTWGQPDRNPNPMSISHATRSQKECLTWQWKQHYVLQKKYPNNVLVSWWIWLNINYRASPANWMAKTHIYICMCIYIYIYIYGLCPSAFGNYLLFFSSPLKLCQVGWGQTHVFRFRQKYLIGFRLWLGHSRTFTELSISHTCCVLIGSLTCWRVKLLPSRSCYLLGFH